MCLFSSREVGRVGYGVDSVCVISTNCSAEVSFYFWKKRLQVVVRLTTSNGWVYLVCNREVDRSSSNGNSVFVLLRYGVQRDCTGRYD